MLPLLLAFATAHAEPHPVVIRFDSNGTAFTAPLVVKLTSGGTSTDVVIADDGERPDFAKGDGRYAGVTQAEATEVEFELVAGGKSVGKGAATFEDPESPHDVDLSVTNGALTVAVSSPPSPNGGQVGGGNPTPPGDPSVGGTPPGGGEPTGSPAAGQPGGQPLGGAEGATPPQAGSTTRAPVTFPQGDSSSDGLLFIGFGVGLLALLGVAWFWRRSRSGSRARTAELQVVPEPGLFAPKFPSLSDGLSAWVAEGQAGAFVNPLLAHLAQHHRVLVVARAEVEVRPLHGGPVYRIVGVRPGLVGDVAEALSEEGGAPLVVLIVLEAGDRESLRDYRDLLPKEVGGIVLLDKAAESGLPRVDVAVAPGGWVATHGEVSVTLVDGGRRLEVVGAG